LLNLGGTFRHVVEARCGGCIRLRAALLILCRELHGASRSAVVSGELSFVEALLLLDALRHCALLRLLLLLSLLLASLRLVEGLGGGPALLLFGRQLADGFVPCLMSHVGGCVVHCTRCQNGWHEGLDVASGPTKGRCGESFQTWSQHTEVAIGIHEGRNREVRNEAEAQGPSDERGAQGRRHEEARGKWRRNAGVAYGG
jgi:hypothetical protein